MFPCQNAIGFDKFLLQNAHFRLETVAAAGRSCNKLVSTRQCVFTFPLRVELKTNLREVFSFTFTEKVLANPVQHSFLIVSLKCESAIVGALNQEKAFSMIVKLQSSRRFVSSSSCEAVDAGGVIYF